MKEFKEYYSREQIIKYLCKIRVSYANKRHKKYLLDKLVDKKNHLYPITTDYDDEINKQLDEILPKRRLWITNGFNTYKHVYDKKNNGKQLKKIETDDKNKQILFNTIRIHSKQKSKYSYLVKLDAFIKGIQTEIETLSLKIEKPDIVPEIKETNKSKKKYLIKKGTELECRPISRFKLKERIVISLTNKYLTELFDEFFEASSLAFRAKDKFYDLEKNHLLAISRIIKYKKEHQNKDIYVAECDLKKFYDTVNHKKCKVAFDNLTKKSKDKYPKIKLEESIYLFNEYLNCYNFQDCIKVLNGDNKYWNKQRDSNGNKINGKYSWVDICDNEYYKTNKNEKIGVPQGGALSGLIANIMLDYADKKLINFNDLFYVRYCDDMILMHEDMSICNNAIETYQKSTKDLLLFNHNFRSDYYKKNKNYLSKFPDTLIRKKNINSINYNYSFELSLKPFWECKSKGPYMWGKLDISKNIFPWISFVGYEIDYNCNIRIRKRSLIKEIQKQNKIVTSIIRRIRKNNYKYKVARNNTIYRSAFEKLNGMAVGRIKLYNYKTCENKICWAHGFRCLNFNKYSKVQLRILDRNKNKCLNILVRNLEAETAKSKASDNNEDILKMGKPFSYYYQAGEKKNEA